MDILNSIATVMVVVKMEIGFFSRNGKNSTSVFDKEDGSAFHFDIDDETRGKLAKGDTVHLICFLNDKLTFAEILVVLAKKVNDELETIFSVSPSWTKKRCIDIFRP